MPITNMRADGEATLAVTAECPFCDKPSEVTGVPTEGFQRWWAGEFIQNALPGLTPDQREVLISGTHPECWDKAFPPEDEED